MGVAAASFVSRRAAAIFILRTGAGIVELKEKYAAIHRQGWLPIFVKDRFDALMLAEACMAAGIRVIEVTCRRPGAAQEIAAIKRKYPDLLVIAGSTVDYAPATGFLQSRGKPVLSVDALADAGADGFASQLAFSAETLGRLSGTHIFMPGVETLNEALLSLRLGAHFVKFWGCDPARVKMINRFATFELFPVLVTGGVTLAKMSGYVEAGTAVLATGWDAMLGERYGEQQQKPDFDVLVDLARQYADEMQAARMRFDPNYSTLAAAGTDRYLRALANYHPFVERPQASAVE